MLRRPLLLLALLLLAACNASTPAIPGVPTAVPPTPTLILKNTPAVVTPLVPQSTPTVLPTPAPAPPTATPGPGVSAAEPLPAPLYLIEKGQMVRLERDGQRRSQITSEPALRPDVAPINRFDISPSDGALAYIVDTMEGDQLVLGDAERRQSPSLLFMEGGVQLGNLRWSPDGKTIAVRIARNPDAETPLVSGTYLLAIAGGAPQLLLADDPVDNPANPSPELRIYEPLAWAPDGSALLLAAPSAFYEGCLLALKPLSGNPRRLIAAPEGLTTICQDASWSRDGASIYLKVAPQDSQRLAAGLGRADPATATASVLVPGEAGGTYTVLNTPRQLADGKLYFFLAELSELPLAFVQEAGPVYTMTRAAADGVSERAALRGGSNALPLAVLWAEDGSGAVVVERPPTGDPAVVWLPSSGAPPLPLPLDAASTAELHWGRP